MPCNVHRGLVDRSESNAKDAEGIQGQVDGAGGRHYDTCELSVEWWFKNTLLQNGPFPRQDIGSAAMV